MNHFNLIQNEFLKLAVKSPEKKKSPSKDISKNDKTWSKFYESMGHLEVPNPDPKRKSDKIKITSLRGSPTDTPKGKLLREIYNKWKGSGSRAVKDHVKSLHTKHDMQKQKAEIKSLKQQLKNKKEKTESNKLKEKIESKKKTITQNEQKVAPEKSDHESVVITNKLNDQYNEALANAKTNASKLHGSVDILGDIPKPSTSQNEELKNTANNINDSLDKLGIHADVSDVTAGPVFSTYHVKFDVKDMKKIQGSGEEIGFILGKPVNVRINREKHTADIEMQNDVRSPVMMKELVTSNKFVNKAADPKSMPIILGKDKDGEPEIVDLSDSTTPHALIVGQTGAGKSVLLHQIISSVLYGKDKKDAQLVLLDPKGGAEFGGYDGSENLAEPVAKTPKSSLAAISRLHKEMEDRYKLFGKVGVKNINEFNELVTKNPDELTKEQRDSLASLNENEKKPITKKVLVADELSDLMSNDDTRREMINHINALGRKARASGIHMVLATQFPSKRVIPTEIQSNLPLKAIMKMDSSDGAKYVETPGAENLLGKGDMIVKAPGGDKRVQSGFIKDTKSVAKEFGGTGKEKTVDQPKSEPEKQNNIQPEKEQLENEKNKDLDEPDLANSFQSNLSRLRKKLDDQKIKIEKVLADAKLRQEEIQKRLNDTQQLEDGESKIEQQNEELSTKRQSPDKIENTEPVDEVIQQKETEPKIDTKETLISPKDPNINLQDENSDLQNEIDELTKPVPINDVNKTTQDVQEKKKKLFDKLKNIFKTKK